MKKDVLKGFLLGTGITALLMGSLSFAGNYSETVQRFYRDIKIKLDETEITPKDATGKVVEPFIVDGTTYLPVRAISNALGMDVNWEEETNTIHLQSKGEFCILGYYQDIKSVYAANWQGPENYFIGNADASTGEVLTREEVLKRINKSDEEITQMYNDTLIKLCPSVYETIKAREGYDYPEKDTMLSVENYTSKVEQFGKINSFLERYLPIFIDEKGNIYTMMTFHTAAVYGYPYFEEFWVNLTNQSIGFVE